MDVQAERAGQATFERIAQQLRDEIKSGTLTPGAQLPNQREVAARFGVAVATAQRALGFLQEEGWITSRPGVGRVVAATPGREPATLEQLSLQLTALRAEVKSLRESVEQLRGDRA
ncbi:GntR family transcriptional regulator [Amycolatopsis mediterranei S699]|uniref:GntR family transcriptional regulator n=2 Tax=Amycolatopsis mediterranei TaxID=33910 RepID=A0A0H3DE57_AMYMU|nr:GntR family transcriptional regulator [Amycolatopsis mediterranei]ADJ47909.1 GntR family transcriptional regulator [Amycolatopsis mediterranei U32]AEK44804.1 GntR family transcriptional regulator [Amycolatopsis mediterranei S699]AFO79621.1 GntR family transcriptional regulator [Amycolatopsis mediterranei S699]AGT86749.1 GntR family transcriptional regulator [Amycolatopsis mediterranei RB]KDO11010.1 GntR family transcriptional regulator [Amycolatopsis mediterranei]